MNVLGPCFQNAGQEACNAANGLPPGPASSYGSGSPEGVVIGYIKGGQFYFDDDADKLYVFGGIPRTKTGWVILN